MPEMSPQMAELIRHLESSTGGLLNRLVGQENRQKELLAAIGERDECAVLPALLPFALSRDRAVAEVAASTVSKLVLLLPKTSLAVFEEAVRSVLLGFDMNHRLTQDDINRLASLGERAAGVVALATMDVDGYVREAALRQLACISGASELPFVLVRLNDWVEQIRLLASRILEQCMTPDNASCFVGSLPLVLDLGGRSRTYHSGTIDSVVTLLQRPETRAALLDGTGSPDARVRRHCLSIALGAKDVEKGDILLRAAQDGEPMIRLWAARELSSCEIGDLPEVGRLLEQDRSAPVRKTILQLQAEGSLEAARVRLTTALLDANPSVRSIAQYYLRKANAVTLPGFYVDAVTKCTGKTLEGAIAGIAETGSSRDAAAVAPFAAHKNRKVRRVAIKALARLADEDYEQLFMELLSTGTPGDSKKARDVLARKRRDSLAQQLWEAFQTDPRPHVRGNALLVVSKLSKWVSLSYLLRAAGDADASLANDARGYLRRWRSDFAKSFSEPTEEQRSAVIEALERFSGNLGPEFARELRFAVKPFTQ